jgi:hypothetical protein
VDEIRELLQRLGQLTDDEMSQLRDLVKAKFTELDTDDATVDDTAVLVELGEITEQIMAEGAAREQKAQEAKEQREAAREKIRALGGDGDDEPEDDGQTGEDKPDPDADEDKDEPEADADSEPAEDAPEPVAASGTVQRMARRKPVPSPEAQPSTGPVLTASSGYQRGRPIEDPDDLSREMAEVIEDQVRNNRLEQKVVVASARIHYPEDRRLGGDAQRNTQIIDAICGNRAPAYDRRTGQALGGVLTATGGICQPVNVDYTLGFWATADTPLIDGLPGFEATRGGIRFVVPPNIAEWEAATGIWTEATDAEPGSATKPVKVLVCGEEVVVLVEAVSTRIGFGNMQSRFAPEQVAVNTDAAMAAAARKRENNLLELIEGIAVKDVSTKETVAFGTTRALLTVLDANLARFRNLNRLPRSQTIAVIFPEWLKDMIRADLVRESAHQQDSSWNSLMVSDDQIEDLFTIRGLNPIWHLDGQPEPTSKAFPKQSFAAYTAEAENKPEWPEKMAWYMYPEGQLQRLDAGRLDLGVVRDSTLDATNDYETFVEVFESIAFRGYAKGCVQFVSTLCPSGGSGGTVTATCP